MSGYIVRNEVTESLPARIGRLGPHRPQWSTADCPSCGSAPCGPHPDILMCEYCAEDWPCGPVATSAQALETMAEHPDPVARVARVLLLERAALLRGDVVAGSSPPWPAESTAGKLRAARRVNAVTAVVADGHRHFLAQLAAAVERNPVEEAIAAVPLDLAGTMFNDVVAALGGETDPEAFHLHPEVNSTHLASLAHLTTTPLEDR
jgi:hypothetical protein